MDKKKTNEEDLIANSSTIWEKRDPASIFQQRDIKEFIEESRPDEKDERVYTHIELSRLDAGFAKKLDKLLSKLKSKDNSLKKISAGMKTALARKNRKIAKLLKYISILESMLEENNIDFKTLKSKIKDGEIHLTSRKIDADTSEVEDMADEYIEAVEIELDDEGHEITEES